MPQKDASKDPEKMVMATAYAMAMADGGVGTPRVVKLYIHDARKVLLDVAKAAKRQKWSIDELVLALEPTPQRHRPNERDAGPPRRGEP